MIYAHILDCNSASFRCSGLTIGLTMMCLSIGRTRKMKVDGQATMGVANCGGPGGNRTHDQLGVSEVS